MIEIVANEPRYYEFVRTLRNDERVKSGFIDQEHITPDQHAAYMAVHAHEYLIALYDGSPAGYVGSVDGDIRVCTHPDYQGKGVARAMIEGIMKLYPDSVAKVKVDNTASLQLFESLGFERAFFIMVAPATRSDRR